MDKDLTPTRRVDLSNPSEIFGEPKALTRTRQQRTLKILVAFQTEGEDGVETVETTAEFFHNGYAYVVTGQNLPYAEHPNLAQAALDWLRIALLQFGSDFMRRRR